MFAIHTVIGGILLGQISFWNWGLVGGFGNYILAMSLCAVMFLILANSLSELSSILPFAGKAYNKLILYFYIIAFICS
jgi:hypothetical protein